MTKNDQPSLKLRLAKLDAGQREQVGSWQMAVGKKGEI